MRSGSTGFFGLFLISFDQNKIERIMLELMGTEEKGTHFFPNSVLFFMGSISIKLDV